MSQVQPYSAQQHDPQAEEQRLPPRLVHDEALSAPGFSSASLWPAIGGALAAAIVGGIVWGRVLVETDYEVGFLAGPGLRLGLRGADLPGRRARNEGADDRGGRGRARNPDRPSTSPTSISSGTSSVPSSATRLPARVSYFDTQMVHFFLDDFTSLLSGFDIVWAVIAVATAWRIPRVVQGSSRKIAL
jgi:hypothetical protein